MPINEITQLLQIRIFRPFRIHVTDGAHYDILFPSQCLPTARAVLIGIPGDNLPPYASADWVCVDLVHITRLEPLPQESPGNGQATT